MSKAFGRPVDQVFSQLSSKPVAAASLGQVYRGKLKPEFGGREVAVKVQRPDVLEQVCLDLYLMRQAAEAISALPEVREGVGNGSREAGQQVLVLCEAAVHGELCGPRGAEVVQAVTLLQRKVCQAGSSGNVLSVWQPALKDHGQLLEVGGVNKC